MKTTKLLLTAVLITAFLAESIGVSPFLLEVRPERNALRPAATHLSKIKPAQCRIAVARDAFRNPQKYRDLILDKVRVSPLELYDGKAIACLFITRFCPVGCEHCFFGSPPPHGRKETGDAFTEEGITRLIKFLNDANMGYLLVSGGGEPFMEKRSLLRMVEQVKSDKIVLVTSGYWANKPGAAKKIIDELYEAFKKRTAKGKVILRVSVDKWHVDQIGMKPILNIIETFQERFAHEENFELQIHSIWETGKESYDPTIDNLLQKLGNQVKTTSLKSERFEDIMEKSAAGETVKITSKKMEVALKKGLRFTIGFAKLFHADFNANLNDASAVERNIDIFNRDMMDNQQNNTAVAHNVSSRKGLNFAINYDGFTRVWGADSPDYKSNLYEDDYNTVVNKAFADVISLAFIEKGFTYRDAILNEVNPRAVIRTKVINIRDFIGSITNEEAKTRLYLTIRVLQDYIKEGRIKIKDLPESVHALVSLDKDTLIRLYNESDYSIIEQYIGKKEVSADELLKLYRLIKLGHYDITGLELIDAIKDTDLLDDKLKAEFFIRMIAMPLNPYKIVNNPQLQEELEALEKSFIEILAADFKNINAILASYKMSAALVLAGSAMADPALNNNIEVQRWKTEEAPYFLNVGGYVDQYIQQLALAGSPAGFFSLFTKPDNINREIFMPELIAAMQISADTVERDMRILRRAGLITRENRNAIIVFKLNPELINSPEKIGIAQQILDEEYQVGDIAYKSNTKSERERIIKRLMAEVWGIVEDADGTAIAVSIADALNSRPGPRVELPDLDLPESILQQPKQIMKQSLSINQAA